MGDDGRLYLAPELVPAYRNQIVKLASVLTPNQFEAELLTDVKIESKQNALKACQVLHDQGIQTVVSMHTGGRSKPLPRMQICVRPNVDLYPSYSSQCYSWQAA